MKLSRGKWGNEDREITNERNNGNRKQTKMKRLRLKKIERMKVKEWKKRRWGKMKIEYHEDKGRNRFHIKDFIHDYFQFYKW